MQQIRSKLVGFNDLDSKLLLKLYELAIFMSGHSKHKYKACRFNTKSVSMAIFYAVHFETCLIMIHKHELNSRYKF